MQNTSISTPVTAIHKQFRTSVRLFAAARKRIALVSFAVACAASLLLSGCASLNNPTTEQRVLTSCKLAAYVGTAEFLRAHPETRPAFVTARDELKILENAQAIDWVTLLAIIQRLPVKELKSDRATLIITSATILLSDYAGSLPLDKQTQLKAIALALDQGITLGLGS